MLNNIGPYKILREISSGGMASVYLAQNIKNNQYVAIKILHERLLSKEKIYKRFTQEGLLNLNHKNIVKVFDIGVSNTGPYLVMEYVDGIDLEEYIKRSGKLEIQKVLNIFYQLLSALTYVHRIGIIHRDIKPKNILIDKNGVVKLTDFGIAKLIYSHIETSTGGYLGAPAYSSPEQMNGEDVDNRSDIYSLGVTLYQMLAGVSPFANDSLLNLIKRKFEKRYEPITKYRNDIPYNLISIINRCIEVNPKDRPKSVNEIASILNDMKDTVIIERPGRKIQKRFNLAIIISVTVVLFITFIFYIFIISEKTKNISEEKSISMTDSHEETTLIETTVETSEVSVIISEETSEIIEIETIAVETTSVSSESETSISETIPESAIIENMSFKNQKWTIF